MGFSVIIAGAITMIVTLSLIVSSYTLLDNAASISLELNKRFLMHDSIMKTDIRISSLQASASNNTITLVIDNNGTSKLWNYDDFDLIITYDANMSNNKVRITENLVYSETLDTGKWIGTINSDILDPGILNTDESMNVACRVQYTIYAGGIVIATLSTDNGVVVTKAIVV